MLQILYFRARVFLVQVYLIFTTNSFPWLTIIVVFPITAGSFIFFLPHRGNRVIRRYTLSICILGLLLTTYVFRYHFQSDDRSQGVQIHNKHIELIVRQITSKVLVSEDRMSNVFSPGELIGLLRAERMGRALEEGICYRAILVGITRASLNTQSFISEASFQETARVLAKAALGGRIDWLKGLKENVVLGGMVPVGTGFQELVHLSRQRNNILLETKKKNLFEGEMRDILFHHRKLFSSYLSKNFHDISKQPFIGFNDS